jgi:hypothetical protein
LEQHFDLRSVAIGGHRLVEDDFEERCVPLGRQNGTKAVTGVNRSIELFGHLLPYASFARSWPFRKADA